MPRASQIAGDVQMNLGGAYGSVGKFAEAAECFARAVELAPDSAAAAAGLAQARMAVGQLPDAISQFRRALELNPADSASKLRLAWILATSREDTLQNGQEALKLVDELTATDRANDPRLLDVLAAACAASGDFERAVTVAGKAIAQLPSDAPLRRAIEQRRRMYEQRQAYRE